jgi:hypothetical protein
MAQQWLATAVREQFRGRGDTLEQADEAARVRAWLATLPLQPAALAALDEPLAALEDGLRQSVRDARGDPSGGGAARR